MEFIAFIMGLLILMYVVDKITNNILRVKKKKISETSGKSIDRWGRTIFFIIFLITLWFGITNDSDSLRIFYWLTCLALLFVFQAIMEIIFLKESKQYISTTILLIIVLVIMYNIDNLPFM